MRTLIIDNYDSYTFNLFQLLAEVNGEEPLVLANDAVTLDDIQRLAPDNVVLSPGPGHPAKAGDFGVCSDIIRAGDVPLLGVCLGHQGLAVAAGGVVDHAPEVMHGRRSAVFHDDDGLFRGLPQGFLAVRYHSLCVHEPLPGELARSAWTADGVVMGLRHRRRPQWGVQFHPESVLTEHGRRLLENFRDLTRRQRPGGSVPTRARRPAPRGAGPSAARRPATSRPAAHRARAGLTTAHRLLDQWVEPEAAFGELLAGDPLAFWLDTTRPGGASGRFSFMGGSDGPLAWSYRYSVGSGHVVRHRRDGRREVTAGSILDHLDRETARLEPAGAAVPFDFVGGFVGYLGYELKAECGGERAYQASTPDAAFLFADRLLAFDHLLGQVHLVCVHDCAHERAARNWLDATAALLAVMPPGRGAAGAWAEVGGDAEMAPFVLARGPGRYLDDIARCREYLHDGETYEICLTNRLRARVAEDPLAVYRWLRRLSPARFAAFQRFGDVAVLSSSPERFLRLQPGGQAEAGPVKGTAPRGSTPADDLRLARELREQDKTRAENLMIVDLVRNDLGKVCEVGSVHVPELMAVETLPGMHQLVSTVRGRLRAGATLADCIRATFPGGSMTGAPKRRTMRLIDELEGEARGVYSGVLGYLSAGGAADLSMVIRTIVLAGDQATIGTGGAIVAQSDPGAELEEMLLKARAPIAAVRRARDEAQAAGGSSASPSRRRRQTTLTAAP